MFKDSSYSQSKKACYVCVEQSNVQLKYIIRVPKYSRFGVFYSKLFQLAPMRLERESLWLQKSEKKIKNNNKQQEHVFPPYP